MAGEIAVGTPAKAYLSSLANLTVEGAPFPQGILVSILEQTQHTSIATVQTNQAITEVCAILGEMRRLLEQLSLGVAMLNDEDIPDIPEL